LSYFINRFVPAEEKAGGRLLRRAGKNEFEQ
jgi:hypothetical protein